MQPSQPAEKANVSSADLMSRGVDLLSRQRTGILRFRTLQLASAIILVHSFFLIRNREWR